jgi:hypothetical protein
LGKISRETPYFYSDTKNLYAHQCYLSVLNVSLLIVAIAERYSRSVSHLLRFKNTTNPGIIIDGFPFILLFYKPLGMNEG